MSWLGYDPTSLKAGLSNAGMTDTAKSTARDGRHGHGLLRAGLIGHPIHHSWSPVMQAAAFEAVGIAAGYELWDTEPGQLAGRIATLRQPEMLGANVTIPYKTEVLPYLDAGTQEVEHSLGAVNTIVCQKTAAGARLVGYNTDVLALQRVLGEEHAWSSGDHLLVVGAGGAARATLAVALQEGVEPWIAVRRPEAGHRLLAAFVEQRAFIERWVPVEGRSDWRSWVIEHVVDLADAGSLAAVLRHTHVLVQSTPIGTGNPGASPVPLPLVKQLPTDAFVFDMVYNPPVTALVSEALAHGLRAYGGLTMLLYQ
ncbi:MAG: shikimate dehydrogenase family protein, partial [Ktedonobacterales bacterium]